MYIIDIILDAIIIIIIIKNIIWMSVQKLFKDFRVYKDKDALQGSITR